MSAKFSFTMDTGTVGSTLNRLSEGLTAADTARFEGLLVAGWADALARAHVDTGRLKASLNISSQAFPSYWQGTLHSIHHGVFELARGGSHYYHHGIKNNHMGPPQMIDAIKAFMRGRDL